MKRFIQKLINRETVLYVVFGALTTLVNYLVFLLLYAAAGQDEALLVNVVAFIAAVTFAYITNKLWVFESKSWAWDVLKKEIISFIAARLLTFGLEELGLFIYGLAAPEGYTILGFDGTLIAKLFLTVIVIILNYIASKLVIFKK